MAVENAAHLEWGKEDAVDKSTARMVDSSEGGALLDVESPPPLHQTVWCRLKEPAPTDWIKARVVRQSGFRQVALEFLSSCPFDFTLAATLRLNFDVLVRDAGWR